MSTHCQRCGRPLKDPRSRARGFGPACYEKFTQERLKTLGLDGEDKPMSEIITFQYGGLDDSTREFVEDRTERIRELVKRSAQDIVAIGIALQEVKERLPHGQFRGWLETEFQWSVTTAWRFMRVAEEFKNSNLEHFAPSALYLLAAPSTPEEARERAKERAERGEVISHSTAQEIVKEHRPEPEPSEEAGAGEEPAWLTAYIDGEDFTFFAIGESGKVLVAFLDCAVDVAEALGADAQIVDKPEWGDWGDGLPAIKISALHAPTLRRLEEILGPLNIVRSTHSDLKHFADNELVTVEYRPSADDSSRAGREIDSGIPGTRAWQFDPLPPDELAQEAEEVEPRGDDTEAWMDSLAHGEEYDGHTPRSANPLRDALDQIIATIPALKERLEEAVETGEAQDRAEAAYMLRQIQLVADVVVDRALVLKNRPEAMAYLRRELDKADTLEDLNVIGEEVTGLRVSNREADAIIDAFQQDVAAKRRKLERAEQARQEAQGL